MKRKETKAKNRGVTLVALVVTVVVTIIIASITLGTLLGENGIIKNSQSSKETAEQQSERIAVEQATTAAMTQDRYGKLEESIFKEELDNATEGAKTNTYDDIFSVIVTFEDTKRAYEVDTETGEVTPIPYPYENVGISLSYSLEKDGRTWLQDGSEWTNDNVVVTVNFDENNSEYNDWTENKKIMYRLEKDTEWKEYNDSSKIVSERNQKVYVKVQGDENRTKVVEGETKYIDKIKPVIRNIEVAGNEVSIEATDEASGIIGYAVTTSKNQPTNFTSCTNTKEFNKVVTASATGRNYYVWVKDAAGNIGSNKDTVIAEEIPSGDGIIITHIPTEWTNGDVTATASSQIADLEIQMSTDNSNWKTTKTLTVEQNGTVYARFWNGNEAGSATTHQISNIDKIKPTITVNPETSNASKTKEITITARDEGGSGLSSSNSYQCYLSTSKTSQEGGEWKDYTSGQTFPIGTGLNGTYYLHIKPIKDNATNISTTASTQVYGPYVFANKAPTITISPNNQSNYTKSTNVIITVTDNNGVGLSSSNSYQYYLSTSSTSQVGGSWQNYISGQAFPIGEGKTGTYYIHVKSVSDNAGNSSGNKVSGAFYFDNTAPVITKTPSNPQEPVKNATITITASDTGGSKLNNNNSYQYYLSTSSTSFSGGSWTPYKSGESFTIGTGLNGTYYLFVKQISDMATNKSKQNGTIITIGGTEYHRFGAYTFQNLGIYVALNGNTLGFFDTEQKARAYADSTAHYFGNIEGENYTYIGQQPWYTYRTQITTVKIFDSITPRNTGRWFAGLEQITNFINLGNLKMHKNVSMEYMFYGCKKISTLDLSSFNTSSLTNMTGVFQDCLQLSNLNISTWNTSNVTDMKYMFCGDSKLASLNVSNFNTSKVTNMEFMFYLCSSLVNLNLNNFDTSNVTTMQAMFWQCENLTSLDLSKFNVSKVVYMNKMFQNCYKITNINISTWNTSNVIDMQYMFCGDSKLPSINLSSFNTSKVTNMHEMFSDCNSLTTLNLRNFDTRNVTDMIGMFRDTPMLSTIYVGGNWSTSQANTQDIFTGCGTNHVTY